MTEWMKTQMEINDTVQAQIKLGQEVDGSLKKLYGLLSEQIKLQQQEIELLRERIKMLESK